MKSDREVLERFANILAEYQTYSSTAYDNLRVENKPSRSVLSRICGSWGRAVEEANRLQRHTDIRILRQQVEDLTKSLQTTTLCLEGTEHLFGIVSDTHFGSLFSDIGLLRNAYQIFNSRKVHTVFHIGDILDGQRVYKGHEFEVLESGADGQIDLCVHQYPQYNSITTYFINGNHDRSFWKRSGFDIGPKISMKRSDLVYLGFQEVDVKLGDPDTHQATVRLFHPEDGSAYAISYKGQRYVSELSSVVKPDLLIMGHYHKSEFLYYQDCAIIQAGCLQKQTPFMRGRRLSAALGFWIVKLVTNENGIAHIAPEFFVGRG